MKSITSIYLIAFSFFTFSQTATFSDTEIEENLVGNWQHIRSIEPNGNVESYQRDIQLFADGTGMCIKYTAEDTVFLPFEWTVSDSTIHLYVTGKKGQRINTDNQYISMVNERLLQMQEQFSDNNEYGKSCAYRRKKNGVIAEY